jgi:ATP-binding cassette subfamily B protein IrtA
MKKNIFKIVFSFASECKGKMILSVLFSIISVIAGFIPYIGVYKILAAFFAGNARLGEVSYWCMICIIGYTNKLLFFGISTTLSHISAYTILETIRRNIAEKLLGLPLGFVLSEPIGKLKNIMIDRVETIELPLAHLIPEGIAYTVVPLGVFIYLFSIHWIMALAALVTIPIVLLSFGPAMRNISKQYDSYIKTNNYMNSVIVEYIEGIEVIKAFNQSALSYQKYTNAIEMFKDFTLKWYKSTWVSGNIITSVLPSTLVGTVPVGMLLYMKGELTPAQLAICIILSMGLMTPLMGLTGYINALKMIKYAVLETDEILKKEELPDAAKPVEIKDYSVEFKNVSFAYQKDAKEQVLKNVTLSIPEKSFTALVGPSGGGKSTIAKLVPRFWDALEGVITIGKTNIKDIPLNQLSHMVSYVAQDNFLFNCSLKENIRLGNPAATDEEVYKAARAAQCEEFVLQLEKGYDTMAGEAGDKLSGGEKQRISIARMILKNAPIVILDEATAFTDPENEAKIQEAILRLTQGKTLLVIAHRLSTVKNANHILVLKNGEIEAEGSHEELMSDSLLYKNMWNAHIGAKKWAANVQKKEGKVICSV